MRPVANNEELNTEIENKEETWKTNIEKRISLLEERNGIQVGEKAVVLLDSFTKVFCRVEDGSNELKFRCDECPFKNYITCTVKEFKNKFAPDYDGFGCMGDH